MIPPSPAFAEHLGRRLRAAGLAFATASQRLERPSNYISRLVSGDRRLKVEHVAALAELLEVPPSQLYHEVDELLGLARPAPALGEAGRPGAPREALVEAVLELIAEETGRRPVWPPSPPPR